MAFLEFWRHQLSDEEIKAIKVLEQQILALDKEWVKYERHNFTDWNKKFHGMSIKELKPSLQIPLRDANIEKKEFNDLWRKTTSLFHKTVRLIGKGKAHDAMIVLFNRINRLEALIKQLESEERTTVSFLRRYFDIFQKIFDNNYGEGYFENEVLTNYEIRFRILEILKNEYELIRYLLSDVI